MIFDFLLVVVLFHDKVTRAHFLSIFCCRKFFETPALIALRADYRIASVIWQRKPYLTSCKFTPPFPHIFSPHSVSIRDIPYWKIYSLLFIHKIYSKQFASTLTIATTYTDKMLLILIASTHHNMSWKNVHVRRSEPHSTTSFSFLLGTIWESVPF